MSGDAGFTDEPRFSPEQAVRIIQAAIARIEVEGYRLRGESDTLYVLAPNGAAVDVF